MTVKTTSLSASCLLALGLIGTATAGPFEEGEAAYRRGDYTAALRLLQPLAEQGNAVAQNSLGVIYTWGRGVPPDHARAIFWYRKAAEQGDAFAEDDLGMIYAKGEWVQQDFVQAHMWLNLAAVRSEDDTFTHDAAVKYRDLLAAKMTPAQIAEAQRMAREWKPTK